jgi:hypothetical protein
LIKDLKCTYCEISFTDNKEFKNHERTRPHLLKTIEKHRELDNADFFVITGKSAFKNRISTLIFLNKDSDLTIHRFFDKIMVSLVENLGKYLASGVTSIKVNCNLYCIYRKITFEENLFNLNTSNVTFYINDDILEKIENELYPQIEKQNDELNKNGSGWIFKFVSELEVRVSKNDIMKKGGKFIELPNALKLKKAIINVQNRNDDRCFYYCILAKFVKTKPHLIDSYKYVEKELKQMRNIKFDFSKINYPTTLKDIKNFEKCNPHVSVNVYIYEQGKIAPLKVCSKEKKMHYDLLMLKEGTNNFHYAYIKNFSRLVSNQLQNHRGQMEFCKRCLAHYYGKNRLEKLHEHQNYCNDKTVKTPSRYVLPVEEQKHLYFKNYHMETPITYCMFADFETMLVRQDENSSSSLDNLASKLNKLRKIQKHKPIAFSYYLTHADAFETKYAGNIRLPKQPVCYVGKNAARIFFKMVKKVALECERKYKKYLHIQNCNLNPFEWIRFVEDVNCCICKCAFQPDEDRVRHHSHITNLFIGPAHKQCNLKARVPNFLPVFLHNLSKYDAHLILHGYKKGAREMQVIPNTEETYISFSKKVSENFWIRFVDSYRFLSSSLRSLVENLPSSQLQHTQNYFSQPHQFQLITQKGFFCYDYLDKVEKLQQREIPSKNDFYNSLNDEHISDQDYKFVQTVWSSFECRNLEDYLTIYVISDCLLLADVFLSFRKVCLTNYGIDPCYFYSLPGYAFQVMLKLTKVKFDLLIDIDKYLFLEKSMRGGITNTIERYSEANNIHIPKTYDPTKEFNSIFYIDANNLYGFAMSQKMPLRNFEWVDDDDIEIFTTDFILSLDDNDSVGYYLEVDMEYPVELHDFHNAFPFAPERKTPPNSKVSKLLCTLENKKNYVCHYRNLKLCLKHGLKLQKVHKILKFEQDDFLIPYININTALRQLATNEFDKSLFKLMINSCFGKFIENQRNYMNFKLVCTEKALQKSIAKPSFRNSIIFSENLVGIHFYKSKITLNKPIYVGITVLELSRNYMYYFYYEKLKEIFHDVPFPKLLYMDTDSFFLSVRTNDIYPYIKNSIKYFDTSNYPFNHPCYSNVNNKIPGYFKDELVLDQCIRYISLCPKIYSFELFEKTVKKIKGVKKNIVKKEIQFQDFYKCLFEDLSLAKDQLLFKSIKHEIYTIKQNKRALNNFCDKRYFYNNLESLAYGHYKIPHYENLKNDSLNNGDDDDDEDDVMMVDT